MVTARQTQHSAGAHKRSSSEEDGQPEAGSSHNGRIKRTRNRGVLSCVECRRLKAKCDLKVPCGGCIRRGCIELCPDKSSADARNLIQDKQDLQRRIDELERALGSTLNLSQAVANNTSPLSPQKLSVDFGVSDANNNNNHLHSDPQHVGNLVLDSNGRAKYLGPAANQQWLVEGCALTPYPSPPSSPLLNGTIGQPSTFSSFERRGSLLPVDAFEAMPSEDEARRLSEAYFELAAWKGSPITAADYMAIASELYEKKSDPVYQNHRRCPFGFQKFAIFFAVLALGTHVCMEVPTGDPSGMRWYRLGQDCLASGRPTTYATDTALQAMAVLAKYALYSCMPRGAETAWQMRGTCARTMLAMGMHRDGKTWNLVQSEIERRRRIFWEIFIADTFMGRNMGRPSTIAVGQYDTKYPECANGGEGKGGGFEVYYCKLAEIVKLALDASLQVRGSPFEQFKPIWQKFTAYEASLPVHLRSRAALKAMVSVYPTFQEAEAASMPVEQDRVRLALQQYALALDSSGAVHFMLHPFFVQALGGSPHEPSASPYAPAYLAVIERSGVLIAILRDLYTNFRLISARHWFFWTHTFTAAVCLAAVCIIAPRSTLSHYAFAELESVIAIFQDALPIIPHSMHRKNIENLQALRATAVARMTTPPPALSEDTLRPDQFSTGAPAGAEAAAEHLSVAGWMTRLIRLGEDRQIFSLPLHVPVNLSVGPGAAAQMSGGAGGTWDGVFPPPGGGAAGALGRALAGGGPGIGAGPGGAGGGGWAQDWASQDFNSFLQQLLAGTAEPTPIPTPPVAPTAIPAGQPDNNWMGTLM